MKLGDHDEFSLKKSPMPMILVNGGKLSDESVEQIESYLLDSQRRNFHKFLVIQAEDFPEGQKLDHGLVLKDIPLDVEVTAHHLWEARVTRRGLLLHLVRASTPEEAVAESQRALEAYEHKAATEIVEAMFADVTSNNPLWRWESWIKTPWPGPRSPWDWMDGLEERVRGAWGPEGSEIARKGTLEWIRGQHGS